MLPEELANLTFEGSDVLLHLPGLLCGSAVRERPRVSQHCLQFRHTRFRRPPGPGFRVALALRPPPRLFRLAEGQEVLPAAQVPQAEALSPLGGLSPLDEPVTNRMR